MTEETSTHSPIHSSSDASLQLDPSAPSSFRNFQSYIQAIKDLNYLVFSRMRNVFYQKDIFYWLTSEGRRNHKACQLAHEHTGWTLPSGHLPSFIRHIPKG